MTTRKQQPQTKPQQTSIPNPNELEQRMQRISLTRTEWRQLQIMAAIEDQPLTTWLSTAAAAYINQEAELPRFKAAIAAAQEAR